MNRDFAEMLSELCDLGVEFLIVGAHALAVHGVPRATGDMDIWVRRSRGNAGLVLAALRRFGAPVSDLTVGDLCTPDTVFQIGLPPARIDFLTSIDGVEFDSAWHRRTLVEIEGRQLPFLSRDDLIANKRATGRLKDRADLEALERGGG